MSEEWAPPPAKFLVTPGEVARRLDIARDQGRRLIDAGVLGQTWESGSAVFADAEALEAIAARPVVDPATVKGVSAVIVKTGPAAADVTDDPRQWLGYHALMPHSVLSDAVSRWWPVARAADLIGGLLVVSVATVVVHVARIDGVRVLQGGRAAFDTSPVADDEAAPFHAARIRPKAGPIIERVN